jgi:hypothetical protein
VWRVSPKTYATPALTMMAAANAGGSVAFSCGLRPGFGFSAFLLFFYHTKTRRIDTRYAIFSRNVARRATAAALMRTLPARDTWAWRNDRRHDSATYAAGRQLP